MKDEEFELLSPEEKEIEIKRRSHRRLFTAFLFIDVGLLVYIIYSIIRLFASL